jgi:hypothetical protein
VAKHIVAVPKPYMRMKGVIDNDIVFYCPVYTFTEFQTTIQA